MTFPLISSLVLAVGGSVWAVLLALYAFGFLHYSAGFTFLWFFTWLPGFVAWYGYIRRVFGHFIFRRAWITWLISIVANIWSLIVVWSSSGVLPVAWTIMAIIVSIVCLIQEGSEREPLREIAKHADPEEFRGLLAKHRKTRS